MILRTVNQNKRVIRTIVIVSLDLIMTIQKVAVVVVAVVVVEVEAVVVKKANNKAHLKLAVKFQKRRRSVNL